MSWLPWITVGSIVVGLVGLFVMMFAESLRLPWAKSPRGDTAFVLFFAMAAVPAFGIVAFAVTVELFG